MASSQGSIDLSRNSEGLSSEMDKGFYLDQSLSISALSMETSAGPIRFPKGIVVEFSDTNNSNLESLTTSPRVLSPSLVSRQSTPVPHTYTLKLPFTLLGKSSTPTESTLLLKKPILASSLDLSSMDLTTTQPSWEVSLIKPGSDSPKLALESSELEFIWSPRNQSGHPTVAEISSLMCSGTPPDGHKSWKETLPLGLVQEDLQQSLVS
ncbi:uncharacterized protein si:ch73-303b9.1 [Clupea harengus]|uniref:Uncharacterized protein si:ch73-303b9.1 n=1 Tax=Clupea harengus TaxID=7950 RepID=A0A6P3WB51_CLUHA|nr:uncharacterized protein si:ch73-303b9.1 [Clupea harengus]